MLSQYRDAAIDSAPITFSILYSESVQIYSHPPAKLHVREGERVTLDCKASGFPFPR